LFNVLCVSWTGRSIFSMIGPMTKPIVGILLLIFLAPMLSANGSVTGPVFTTER
jgi:hypothetical protein